VKIYKMFLAEHIKSCHEAWEEEKRSNTFCIAEYIFNLPGKIIWKYFCAEHIRFARREIPWEHIL